MGSWYTSSDAYQRRDPDGAVSYALAHLVQKLFCKKTPLFSGAAILTFLTPVTSFLTWPKNDLSKNCRACPPVSNAVYRLSLACCVFEISGEGGGRLFASSVGTKVAQTPVGARVNFLAYNGYFSMRLVTRKLMVVSVYSALCRNAKNQDVFLRDNYILRFFYHYKFDNKWPIHINFGMAVIVRNAYTLYNRN